MISLSKSLLSIQVVTVLVVVIATLTQSSDAKILNAICKLFDAPSRVDVFSEAPGRSAAKTVEFLAFGDAAMDYYQS